MQISEVEVDWYHTITGQGEPLVFLHGGFDSCVNHVNLLGELADRFQVIAVDRRGHGRTADTDAPFNYNLMAEELAVFASKLNLSSFHIVGYSDGANIGLHIASRFPEMVKSLIAIAGNYKGLSSVSEECRQMFDALSVDFVQEHMPEVLEQYIELNPNPTPEIFIRKAQKLWKQEIAVSSERLKALQMNLFSNPENNIYHIISCANV